MTVQISQLGPTILGWQVAVTALALATPAGAQGPRQTSQDEYTRYELLAPDTASFQIDYEVTATAAGATRFGSSE